jgi:hypothetical protein
MESDPMGGDDVIENRHGLIHLGAEGMGREREEGKVIIFF